MKPDLTTYLGKHVHVVIDRPLGSPHPQHPDIIYPVNYGFIPGTRSGDGQPIDAYLLGVDHPIPEAEAVVIAVVVRSNDSEDKLVVAPPAHHFTASEIQAQIAFQEQYFTTRIVT